MNNCPSIVGQEGIDFVQCGWCGFLGRSLTRHITVTHGSTKDVYIAEFGGPVKCSKSTDAYKATGNYDWINRAKARGDDLVGYRERMGEVVSRAIMSNPHERIRRAKTMAANNRTEDARARSSRTTKLTSARPDIQTKRAANLKKWREEHPEEFAEKCTKAMLQTGVHTSKPQKELFRIIDAIFPSQFKLNVRKKHQLFQTTSSHRRYFDICSESLKIVIEFDGKHHFQAIFKDQDLSENNKKDNELNEVLPMLGYCLIRISYDQWLQRGRVKGECVGRLYDLISDPRPGVHFIGEHHAGER